MTRGRLALAGLGAAALALLPGLPSYAADDVTVVLTLRTPVASRVVPYLTRHGFTVVDRDAWTITARGSRPLATHLHGLADVRYVAGLGTQHHWRHTAVPGGWTAAPLRSAYGVTTGDGTGITVASVQFSGWHSGDLSTYVTAAGIAMPDVTQVVVGTGNPTDTSSGGDFEVAMDQEILAATAPKAKQRIYFAGNSTAQAVQLYSRIATDAEAGLVQVVTSSWGMCEPWADTDPQSRAGMEAALARIVAAGATVFSASGDEGGYDCSSSSSPDNRLAVDYPTASPYVVSVGGTRLTGAPGAWTETAWTQPSGGSTFKGYAGGGGESSSVARPAWQSGVAIGGTHRLVPDIAAMADPNSGFGTYATSAGGWVLGGGTSAAAPMAAGHLASTLSAAGRTTGVGDVHAVLYAHPEAFRDVTAGDNLAYAATAGYDRATGLGAPLWSGLAPLLLGNPVVSAPAATRTLDVPVTVTPPAGVTVTAWTAAEGSTVACDPAGSLTPPTSVTLAAGSDRVTRVAVGAYDTTGTCHVGTAPVTLDTHGPVATGSVRPYATDGRTVFSWGATDPAPASGVATYDVCVYTLGLGCTWTATTTARSATLTLVQGRTYVLRVAARDRAGNRGATYSAGRYVVPVDEKALTLSTGWSRGYAAADWYGSHTWSGHRGAAMSRTLTGSKYEVYFTARPDGGMADVYVNGVRVKTFSTYASGPVYRRLVTIASFGTRAARSVRIVVRGTRDSRSTGYVVAVDAIRVAY